MCNWREAGSCRWYGRVKLEVVGQRSGASDWTKNAQQPATRDAVKRSSASKQKARRSLLEAPSFFSLASITRPLATTSHVVIR